MIIARLLLKAYGPFTETVLDFESSGANLHLIYGPNEAGKSSALRAMTDLRFGVPQNSEDSFLHQPNQMRIGGVFIDASGERVGLVRRKGRGSTLSRCDMNTGESIPELPVTPEQADELIAGLERADFEAMFGLNHARLREGGRMLLEGEGELGAALFEASAGTRGIAAILAELDADAKRLFNPHGRAQNATINDARRQLDEQRKVLREAQTKPAEWQALYRSHETSKTALTEIENALDSQRHRENELTELRTVEPMLREHDRVHGELNTLANVPDLSENAREERLAAEQAAARARDNLAAAEKEIARCSEDFGQLSIEQPMLEHADAIERLAAGIESAVRSRIEAGQQQAVIDRLTGEMDSASARIAPGRAVQDVLSAAPSAADSATLEGHLQQINRLAERLEGHQQRQRELKDLLASEDEQAAPPPDAATRQALSMALRKARVLGDVGRQTAESDRQIREFDAQLRRSLADLGAESSSMLRAAQPVLEAEIVAAEEALKKLAQAESRANDEDRRIQDDLPEQRLRQKELGAEGEVVTAETLRQARARRDEGWNLVRRAYVERSDEPGPLGQAFDASRSLPEAFEVAQAEADRQSDLLRADAKRAAVFEECSGRIADMEARRREIEGELTQLTKQKNEFRAAWSQRLAALRLPKHDPGALREWQRCRKDALDVDDSLTALREDRQRVNGEATAAAEAIISALQSAGQPATGTGADELSSLIEQAEAWEKGVAKAEAEQAARIKLANSQRADLAKLDKPIADTESTLNGHRAVLATQHARLFLPVDSTADTVKARLNELDTLLRQAADLTGARQIKAGHQAVVYDLSNQAAGLATMLGESAPALADDFADRMRRRLAQSREQEQQRLALMRDQSRAKAVKQAADVELGTHANTLDRLCGVAGVGSADQLPECEDLAARKRLAQASLASLRQQLAQASNRPEAELRENLAGRDVVTLEGEREHCRSEMARREGEQIAARLAEEQARSALAAIDASDRAAAAREAMESAAARYRSAIRPWARLRLAHALLTESLKRFRERAQAPMVAAASDYFSLMTGGRYTRLEADEEGEKPVLRAMEANGVKKGIDAMSDGTADQLYLALRLAALDLRRDSHSRMPLVLDDVLITSDDERAANILRALTKFAGQGQVMLFTHHRHLIDVARSVLDDKLLAVHEL